MENWCFSEAVGLMSLVGDGSILGVAAHNNQLWSESQWFHLTPYSVPSFKMFSPTDFH